MTWKILPLTEVAEVRLGRQRSPKNHSGNTMRPYLRAANVSWSGLRLDDVKTMNFTDAEMDTYRLRPGDIVLSEASGSPGEVGKPALWNGEINDCAFQNTLIRVRPMAHDPRFLLHYFRYVALTGGFLPSSRGVGINHLGRTRLASWPTPLPTVDEQRRIVEILEDHVSHLDAAVTYARVTRTRIGVARCQQSEYFARRAGGVQTTINEISEFVTDGDHNPPKRVPSGIPHVTAKGITLAGGIDLSVGTYVSSDGFAQTSKRYRPRGDDVIVTCVGTIGRVAVVPANLEFSADRNLAAIRPDLTRVRPHFLKMLLDGPTCQRQMKSASGSTAQPHLYLRELRALPVTVPSLQEQGAAVQEFDEFRNALNRLAECADETVQRTELLQRAVLAAAFSGQLTGRHTDDDVIEELAEAMA